MQNCVDALTPLKDLDFIIGDENINTTPMQTFCDEACEFLNELSSYLMKSPISREFTDLSALAFWCRKANIQKIKENYTDLACRLGRGVCFHIAPSNIAINSIFSYFFGLLAGNSNIVRLASKKFTQVDFMCDLIKEKLSKYPQIQQRTAFVKYARSNTISKHFSKMADCRVIWGGDETIKSFRAFECKPRCVDISFPDRYSICIINAAEIKKANDITLKRLAEGFYNDTYLMDQNACSSPQLIYWLNDDKKARQKFWNFVYEYANKKYNLQDALCVDKFTKFCEDAIKFDNVDKTTHKTNLLYKSEIVRLENVENIRGKGGYFYEYSLQDLNDLLAIISEKYQTITYFGINPQDLRQEIITHKLKGVDRIVPIGKAMDISVIWDGHDFITELSRKAALS